MVCLDSSLALSSAGNSALCWQQVPPGIHLVLECSSSLTAHSCFVAGANEKFYYSTCIPDSCDHELGTLVSAITRTSSHGTLQAIVAGAVTGRAEQCLAVWRKLIIWYAD